MEMVEELAKYGTSGVALGALIMIFMMIKTFLKHIQDAADKHEKAYQRLSGSIDKNTKVTDETYRFLKNLNGSFKKVVKDKLEQ